jgi:hypothetical protein
MKTQAVCSYCSLSVVDCKCGRRASDVFTNPVVGGGRSQELAAHFASKSDEKAERYASHEEAVADYVQKSVDRFSEKLFETRVVDPTTGGEKGSKAQRMDLLPWDTLMKVSEHYHYGASKYDQRNWERGYAWSLSFAALQRHLAAFWQGEDIDEESGSHHLAAAAFHVLAMFTYVNRGLGTDDRPN